MSYYNGKIYCRYKFNIYNKKDREEQGFHRKSKECLSLFEAKLLAKKLNCGYFFCKLSNCWHIGKPDIK